MKKVISMVMAIALCVSLCFALTACGGESDEADTYSEEENIIDRDVAIGGGDSADEFYTGVAGDGSSIFMVGLSVSADGTQCIFAFGNPGSSLVVLGQFVDMEDGFASIFPLDGSEQVDIFLADNGDGTIFIEVFGYDVTLNPVSEAEFMDLANILG